MCLECTFIQLRYGVNTKNHKYLSFIKGRNIINLWILNIYHINICLSCSWCMYICCWNTKIFIFLRIYCSKVWFTLFILTPQLAVYVHVLYILKINEKSFVFLFNHICFDLEIAKEPICMWDVDVHVMLWWFWSICTCIHCAIIRFPPSIALFITVIGSTAVKL